MAYPAPHIVSVAGAHCSGKTHLVRALGGLLETFEAFTGQTDEDFTRKAAIERKFKHGMAAARVAEATARHSPRSGRQRQSYHA